MDPATLATGVDTALDSFATAFGPIVLLVIGFAIGLYGVRLAYGWLTNLVRARARVTTEEEKIVAARYPVRAATI